MWGNPQFLDRGGEYHTVLLSRFDGAVRIEAIRPVLQPSSSTSASNDQATRVMLASGKYIGDRTKEALPSAKVGDLEFRTDQLKNQLKDNPQETSPLIPVALYARGAIGEFRWSAV